MKKRTLVLLLIIGAFPTCLLVYLAFTTDEIPSYDGRSGQNLESRFTQRLREVDQENRVLRKQLSKARNKLLGLQMSIAVQNSTNDGNNKTHIRCLNAEPEIPKCEVCKK